MKAFSYLIAVSYGMIITTSSQSIDETTYLFTFGDSYTSTGFDPLGTQPSAENPMGNPLLGEGTSAGGINWVGYLTAVLNTSLILNYNLAASGACINNSVVHGVPRDLVSQVKSHFATHYASKPVWAPWRSDNTVFAIWIGINDIGDSYMIADPDAMVPVLLECYFSLVDELYKVKARRFLFLNVPPTTRSPRIQAENNVAAHARFTELYNQELKNRTLVFGQTYPDTSVFEYDSWNFMTKILDNETLYGFKDATCQGSGCIWFNSYHPTTKFHRLLAQDLLLHIKIFSAR